MANVKTVVSNGNSYSFEDAQLLEKLKLYIIRNKKVLFENDILSDIEELKKFTGFKENSGENLYDMFLNLNNAIFDSEGNSILENLKIKVSAIEEILQKYGLEYNYPAEVEYDQNIGDNA